MLTALVSAVQTTRENLALIDMRNASPRLSRPDLFELGVAISTQSALTRGKVAMLAALDQQTDAEFFESVARLHGTDVRVFTSFEAAITWLAMREQRLPV